MKNHFIILLILISMSEQIIGQKAMPRFEELKAWKLSYITSNTSMNNRELEVYKCIFEEYENTYHDEIWIKVREMRKELKNSIETIPTEKAASYINVFDEYEKKGIELGILIDYSIDALSCYSSYSSYCPNSRECSKSIINFPVSI